VPKCKYREHQGAIEFQVQQSYLPSQILLCEPGIVGSISCMDYYCHVFHLDDTKDEELKERDRGECRE
jgi:hypothetical protein